MSLTGIIINYYETNKQIKLEELCQKHYGITYNMSHKNIINNMMEVCVKNML